MLTETLFLTYLPMGPPSAHFPVPTTVAWEGGVGLIVVTEIPRVGVRSVIAFTGVQVEVLT